jgi:hypothetical protein
LLETLVASSILFFIISILLPQLYLITIERENLLLQNFAGSILNEKLFEASINDGSTQEEIIMYEHHPFYLEITVEGKEEDSNRFLYRGCMRWTNLREKEEMICGSVR